MVALKMNILPRNNFVLIRIDPPKERTEGGIYLPSGAKMSTGTVLAVGPGAKTDVVPGFRMPMCLSVGERVYIAGNQFSLTYIDGEDSVVLIPEDLVVGTVVE